MLVHHDDDCYFIGRNGGWECCGPKGQSTLTWEDGQVSKYIHNTKTTTMFLVMWVRNWIKEMAMVEGKKDLIEVHLEAT